MAYYLTHLELQIIPLLSQALSNRLIAERLQVSEPTVEMHVQQVLTKLRLRSRALLSGWMLGQHRTEVRAAPGAGTHPMDSLTSREREVAALIARGLTNRQIAAELVITEATVAVHVKHVLSKTGFPSRARVAAWAAQQELLQDLAPPASSSVPPLKPAWSDSARPRGARPRQVGAGQPVAPPRELTDDEWAQIEPLLPPRAPTGRGRADDRQTLNGILWVLGAAARWGDVPRHYGAASTCHLRFQQWQQQGVWDRVWRVLQHTRAEHRDPRLRALPSRVAPPDQAPDAAPHASLAYAGRRQALGWHRRSPAGRA